MKQIVQNIVAQKCQTLTEVNVSSNCLYEANLARKLDRSEIIYLANLYINRQHFQLVLKLQWESDCFKICRKTTKEEQEEAATSYKEWLLL